MFRLAGVQNQMTVTHIERTYIRKHWGTFVLHSKMYGVMT